MSTYNVTARKPGIGEINSYIEAEDSDAAVRQFREDYRLAAYEEEYNKANEGANLSVKAMAVLVSAEPVTSEEATPKPSEPTAEATSEEVIPKVALEQLKSFGISDNDVADLEKVGLTTLSAIITYARDHNGLTSIPGIGAVGEKNIAAAIKAYQANDA